METTTPEPNTLRKGALRTWDAIAQSVALLALVMAVALSTSPAAMAAGAAAPLAYVVVGLGSLCLAYVIIRFTRRMASAGSLYTYISQGLGPATGFIGGWLYAGAFAIGIAFVLAISSLYLQGVLANFHLNVDWFILFCGLLVALFLFAFFDIRIATRVQLTFAALGILAVVVLAIIILAKGGQSGLSLTPFSPAALSGGFKGLFFATIFSFTAFIGFEAAATLGEETSNPRRTIPLAILIAVLVAAVFYILVTYSFSIGYGATVAGATKWGMDPTPLDTLAKQFANPTLATFIDAMVFIDAFVAALAGLNLVARLFYAMGRDRGLPSILGWTHPRFKTPWVGIVVCLVVTFVLGVTLGRSLGAFFFFIFLATIGTFGILAAYILVAISGIVFFLRTRQDKALTVVADVLLPVIAIVLCGATIYGTVISLLPQPPPFPLLNFAPYIAGGWLVLGLIVLAVLWFTNREQVLKFGKALEE